MKTDLEKFKDHKWIRDIAYYDGPLTSIIEVDQEKYLFHWSDVTDTHNIWLIIPLTDQEISTIHVGMRDLFLSKHDFWLAELDGTGEMTSIKKVKKEDILNYIPTSNEDFNLTAC